MALDLGTITSAVVLKDTFSSVMDHIIGGISEFEEAAKKSFPSAGELAETLGPAFNVAAAAVLATTAAVTGLVAATSALASRGADVNDVAETLEHFSGSSEQAEANLAGLRDGVQGTVDDMALMQNASRLLGANVKLNADEFQTLGQAAFVLQNRGLGDTKDMLDLVSDAMITGRTRALAMKLGVIDLGDAQENYAKKLGIEKEMLSEAGKAEATRVQIMTMLRGAVADAGEQEKDFGEKVDTAHAKFSNWLDDLSVAVAQSPVLTTALDELGVGLTQAFGDSQESLIENIVHWIEQGLIHTVDFGLGVVEAARVAHTGFEAIKSTALLAAGAIGVMVTGVADVVEGILNLAAAIPGATDGMKNAATMATAFRESVEETTVGLFEQQEAAHEAALGHDQFNKTLDETGGFLFSMRDKLVSASKEQREHKKAVDDDADAVNKGTDANKLNISSLVDQTKAQDLQKKGLAEASKLWNEHSQLIKESSGTSFDSAIAAVDRWKKDLIRQHKEAHTDTKEFYDAVEAVAKDKLGMVGSHWKELADQSRESLRQQADAAKADYERMRESGLHFSQDALDAQLKKWMDLQDAAAGFGSKAQEGFDKATESAKKTTDQVKTLAGEMISLQEAAARKSAGNTMEVTSQNFGQKLDEITNPWWDPTGRNSNVDKVEAYRLAAQGYSFQEILDIFNRRKTGGSGPNPPPRGPRIPGFAGGGVVMVGEHGPELAALPDGTRVFPNGSGPGGMVINFYVNGSAKDVAREIKEIFTNDQKLRGRIPLGRT